MANILYMHVVDASVIVDYIDNDEMGQDFNKELRTGLSNNPYIAYVNLHFESSEGYEKDIVIDESIQHLQDDLYNRRVCLKKEHKIEDLLNDDAPLFYYSKGFECSNDIKKPITMDDFSENTSVFIFLLYKLLSSYGGILLPGSPSS